MYLMVVLVANKEVSFTPGLSIAAPNAAGFYAPNVFLKDFCLDTSVRTANIISTLTNSPALR
jgi:hypothetical protein